MELDGALTALAGRIDPREMGSRVQRQAPKDLDKKKKATEKADSSEKADFSGFGYADVIEATQDVEGLTYRPRTAETREVYEHILSSIHTAEITPRTSFEVLLTRIWKWAETDKEGGVAVVFDDEEEVEDDDNGYEVKDDSDEEEEEENAEKKTQRTRRGRKGLSSVESPRSNGQAAKNTVSLHSINGFRVQRQISEIYPDPVTTAKATEVLETLSSERSARDCKNHLVELFVF